MDIHLNEMAGDILVFLTGKHSVSGLKISLFVRAECGTTIECYFCWEIWALTHVALALCDYLNSFKNSILYKTYKIILYAHKNCQSY